MKKETLLHVLLNVMSMSSWSLNNVCNNDAIDCQNSQISKPGEIIYGQCYRNAALRRLLKVSFLTCLKECMKTSTCFNVSYRRGWKMCDINGNLNSDVKLVQEHGCFSSNINSWPTNDCQRKGSHLVKIVDASENLWLQHVMIEKNIDKLRIGAHDIIQEGTWRWIYDDTIVDFTNWGYNQPNNYKNQDCAELFKSDSYRWNDGSCTSLLQYVCEK
ncbi:lectin BRA-3-like [Mytilus edulis]|uniref:lectin BRA-3-like n=1 Tax=Mytilus edulis TaxID=6550 RepID=UPI0039EF896E